MIVYTVGWNIVGAPGIIHGNGILGAREWDTLGACWNGNMLGAENGILGLVLE